MITLEQIKDKTGLYFECIVPHAGKQKLLQARQNGKVKTWKRNPEFFRIPVKYGLYECFYISNHEHWKGNKFVPNNAEEWNLHS